MRRRVLGLVALVLVALAFPAAAQRPSIEVPVLEPRTEDVATLDGIIAAFYDVISGPAGEPRQWGRDRTLYVPWVRFVSMGIREGRPYANVMTHQEYVDGSDGFLVRNGFFEQEIARETQRFGNVAHVWSTYQFRSTADGPVQGRGINSIQLYWDGDRWWITAAAWDSEREGNPIPPES